MIKYCGAVAVLLLLVACSSTSDKRAFEREQAEIEAYILACHGGISVSLALKYDFVAPVAAEIERQGTANFLLDTFGWSALYDACYSGSEHCVELLLSRGADPSIRTAGELPINMAWSRIYSDEAREEINAGKLTVDEVEQYKRILAMLAVPELEFEPRSEAANEAMWLEVIEYLLPAIGDPDDDFYWEGGICLKVNGADCPASTIEACRERGYPFSLESETSSREILLDIKWLTDDKAKVRLYIPLMSSSKMTVTYAYGHWMLDNIFHENVF